MALYVDATGSSFGAVINSILPMSAGGAAGGAVAQQKSEEKDGNAGMNYIDQSVDSELAAMAPEE